MANKTEGRNLLTWFPQLYEDELLYSWFARYHLQSGNLSPKQTMAEIFGNKCTIAVPDLPTKINHFHQNLSHFNIPSVKDLIHSHTLFRYYTTFSTKKNKKFVFNSMATGNKPQSIHLMLGIMASSLKDNTYFKYCKKCYLEDIKRLGEPYWKRSHQVPGVLICSKHNELLLDSNLKTRANNKHEFVSASLIVVDQDFKLSIKEKNMSHAKTLTHQMEKMLNRDFNFTPKGLQTSYHFLLNQKGLLSVNGHVYQRLLAEQFINYYGTEFLELMQSTVDIENSSCWLKAITRKHRKSFHPIRHLLFINFLGENIDTFYKYSTTTISPFGKGPFYCLNPAAEHYKAKVISEVIITMCSDTKKPVGTFQCDCGFIYSRRGPDSKPKDLFKIGTVKQYGFIWQKKLNELLKQKFSYTNISKILDCNISTVRKYSQKSAIKNKHLPEKGDKLELIKSQKRKNWLELLEERPSLSITKLREHCPNLYMWLYKNDKEWLEGHSPKKTKKTSSGNRVNWVNRDSVILKDVVKVVASLKSNTEKPVHINISHIGKDIGKRSILEKHLDKLPETKKFLLMNIETFEEYQIRRVKWAIETLTKSKESLSSWEIIRLSGLKENSKVTELVKNLFE